MNPSDFKLYYVGHRGDVWFATGDWRMVACEGATTAPYHLNYKGPYAWHERYGVEPYYLINLKFSGTNLETPAQIDFETKYSVEDINEGRMPWLTDKRFKVIFDKQVHIMAGMTMNSFVRTIQDMGGTIYVPMVNQAWMKDLVESAMQPSLVSTSATA